MEEFKKDLLSLCKRSILGPVLFLLIAVGCILLASTGTDYDPFDGTSSGYAKLDVVYVMGPFAEQSNEDGNTTNEYYIAEDADGYWLVRLYTVTVPRSRVNWHTIWWITLMERVQT